MIIEKYSMFSSEKIRYTVSINKGLRIGIAHVYMERRKI